MVDAPDLAYLFSHQRVSQWHRNGGGKGPATRTVCGKALTDYEVRGCGARHVKIRWLTALPVDLAQTLDRWRFCSRCWPT